MCLSPENTTLWNSSDPEVRKKARLALHFRHCQRMDDLPNEPPFIVDAEGVRLGNVYEPTYLYE